MFSSNYNRFLKSTENKYGNVPHVSRLNLENLNTTPSETSSEPIITEWEKLEISEEEYYDNMVQSVTIQALEIKKEISTIIEVNEDNIEYHAIEDIVSSQQSTDDSDILTFGNIYINNQDNNIEYEEDTNKTP